MKAIFNGRVYTVQEESGEDITILDEQGVPFKVWLGEDGLIVDPTDDEVAEARGNG